MVSSYLWHNFVLLDFLTIQREDHGEVNADSNGSAGSQETGNHKNLTYKSC